MEGHLILEEDDSLGITSNDSFQDGDKVRISDNGDVWDGKTGTVESSSGDEVIVLVDFGNGKIVRQGFDYSRLSENR